MGVLKPCPFCDAETRLVVVTRAGWKVTAQHARWCPFATKTREKLDAYTTEEEAIEAWNRRDGVDDW